jgi:hypothetical protein
MKVLENLFNIPRVFSVAMQHIWNVRSENRVAEEIKLVQHKLTTEEVNCFTGILVVQ